MASLDLEKMTEQLNLTFDKSVPSATMGLSALVSINGKVLYNRALGAIKKLDFKYEQDTIYDLASLTKPLATSLLLCKLYETKYQKIQEIDLKQTDSNKIFWR